MSKLTFKTAQNNLLYRIDDKQTDNTMQQWMLHFAQKEIEIVEVLTTPVNNTRVLQKKNAYIANICGKISHYSTSQIYRDEILPYVQKLANRFGVFKCLFSPVCNFHTGCSQQNTLFRGAKSSIEIQSAITEAFEQQYIHEIKVHNIMASARTGIPIASKNNMIGKKLATVFECKMNTALDGDDCMFIHSFLMEHWSKQIETVFKLQDICTVRVNICRTGVINMFLSIRGGVSLHDNAEILYMPFFEEICKQISDVI